MVNKRRRTHDLLNDIRPTWRRSNRPRARGISKRNRNSLHERECFTGSIGANGVFKFLYFTSGHGLDFSGYPGSHRLVLKESGRTINTFLAH